jgi:hypothetical protein
MNEELGAFPKPRLLSIRKHLEARGDEEPFTTLAQFVSYVHESSARWQQDDWKRRGDDERDVLDDVGHDGVGCPASLSRISVRDLVRCR